MKVALAQITGEPFAVEQNRELARASAVEAFERDADLVVLPVMSLRGADVICVPTAWVPGFDQQGWDTDGMCPQAHGAVLQANLNQVFIACASQAGRAGELDFLGSSVLADPYGKRVLGRAARRSSRSPRSTSARRRAHRSGTS